MPAQYTEQQKHDAKLLWQSAIPGATIVLLCGLNNVRILYKWRKDEHWELGNPTENLRLTLSIRYNAIMDSPKRLTDQQKTEASYLSKEMLTIAKIDAIDRGNSPGRGRPPGRKNGEGKPKKPKKNDVSGLTAEDFQRFRDEHLHPHQWDWYNAGQEKYTVPDTTDKNGNPVEMYRHDIRFIMKSRKIGATWFFCL